MIHTALCEGPCRGPGIVIFLLMYIYQNTARILLIMMTRHHDSCCREKMNIIYSDIIVLAAFFPIVSASDVVVSLTRWRQVQHRRSRRASTTIAFLFPGICYVNGLYRKCKTRLYFHGAEIIHEWFKNYIIRYNITQYRLVPYAQTIYSSASKAKMI